MNEIQYRVIHIVIVKMHKTDKNGMKYWVYYYIQNIVIIDCIIILVQYIILYKQYKKLCNIVVYNTYNSNNSYIISSIKYYVKQFILKQFESQDNFKRNLRMQEKTFSMS